MISPAQLARPIGRLLKAVFRDENHFRDLSFYRRIPIFQGLSSRQLGKIMQVIQKRQYFAGEILFREGQAGRAVFIVRSGAVELTRNLPGGKSRVLGRLGPGQIFGEMALLEDRPRTATARVLEDGEVALLYTATLETLIRRNARIGVKVLHNIAVMLALLLRRTNEEIDRRSKAA